MIKQRGITHIPLLIGLVLIGALIPVTKNLVEQGVNLWPQARLDRPCKYCSGDKCKTRTNCNPDFNECRTNQDCRPKPKPTPTPKPKATPTPKPKPTSAPKATPTPDDRRPPRPTSPPKATATPTPKKCTKAGEYTKEKDCSQACWTGCNKKNDCWKCPAIPPTATPTPRPPSPTATSIPTPEPDKDHSKDCDSRSHGEKWCKRDKVYQCIDGEEKFMETCGFNCSNGKCVEAPAPTPKATATPKATPTPKLSPTLTPEQIQQAYFESYATVGPGTGVPAYDLPYAISASQAFTIDPSVDYCKRAGLSGRALEECYEADRVEIIIGTSPIWGPAMTTGAVGGGYAVIQTSPVWGPYAAQAASNLMVTGLGTAIGARSYEEMVKANLFPWYSEADKQAGLGVSLITQEVGTVMANAGTALGTVTVGAYSAHTGIETAKEYGRQWRDWRAAGVQKQPPSSAVNNTESVPIEKIVEEAEQAFQRYNSEQGAFNPREAGYRSGACGFASGLVGYGAEKQGAEAKMYQVLDLQAQRRLGFEESFQHAITIVRGSEGEALVDLTFGQFVQPGTGDIGLLSPETGEMFSSTGFNIATEPLAQQLLDKGYVSLTESALADYLRITSMANAPWNPSSIRVLEQTSPIYSGGATGWDLSTQTLQRLYKGIIQ